MAEDQGKAQSRAVLDVTLGLLVFGWKYRTQAGS